MIRSNQLLWCARYDLKLLNPTISISSIWFVSRLIISRLFKLLKQSDLINVSAAYHWTWVATLATHLLMSRFKLRIKFSSEPKLAPLTCSPWCSWVPPCPCGPQPAQAHNSLVHQTWPPWRCYLMGIIRKYIGMKSRSLIWVWTCGFEGPDPSAAYERTG